MKPSIASTFALAFATGALHLHACGGYGTLPGYTAHEWGTFTSVQGSDGVPIAWNPFVAVDLPAFVYNRAEPLRGEEHAAARARLAQQALLGKHTSHWLQRMETPVVYFYADAPLTVSVDVRFPEGVISEWFPQVGAFGPAPALTELMPGTNLSFIRWDNVAVVQAAEADATQKRFPVETVDHAAGSASHYFHARHTAANPLVARSPLMTAAERAAGQAEKFLFYRGAGNFTAPLNAVFQGEDRLVLKNTGQEPLLGLQVFEGRGLSGMLQTVDVLKPGEELSIRLEPPQRLLGRPTVSAELRRRLKASLVRAGLFTDEAEAMLATWDQDWLDDDGLRVLYLLPQGWTEKTLPMQLTPAPSSLVRVMVGRAELIRPSVETRLRELLSDYAAGRTKPALAAMSGLVQGRFLEPALTRIDRLESQASLGRLGLSEEAARTNAAFLEEAKARGELHQRVRAAFAGMTAQKSAAAVARN